MRIYTILVDGEKVLPKAYKTYSEALEYILEYIFCPLDIKNTQRLERLGRGFFIVNDTTYQIIDVYVED